METDPQIKNKIHTKKLNLSSFRFLLKTWKPCHNFTLRLLKTFWLSTSTSFSPLPGPIRKPKSFVTNIIWVSIKRKIFVWFDHNIKGCKLYLPYRLTILTTSLTKDIWRADKKKKSYKEQRTHDLALVQYLINQ